MRIRPFIYWLDCAGYEPAGLWVRIGKDHYRIIAWPCGGKEGK